MGFATVVARNFTIKIKMRINFIFVILSVIILSNIVLRLPAVGIDILDPDEVNFFLAAKSFLSGEGIYRNFLITTSGPINIILYSLIFSICKSIDMTFVHYFLLIFTSLSVFILFVIGRKIGNAAIGILSALFFILLSFSMNSVQSFVLYKDYTVMFFSIPAAAVLLSYFTDRPRTYKLFIVGVLLGLVSFVKQTGVIESIVFIFAFFIEGALSKRNIGDLSKKLLAIISGAALIYTVIILYLVFQDSLGNFILTYLEHNLKYRISATTFSNKIQNNFLSLVKFCTYQPVIWICFIFFLCHLPNLSINKNRDNKLFFYIFIALWGCATLIVPNLLVRCHQHYYIPSFPAVSLGGAIFAFYLFKKIKQMQFYWCLIFMLAVGMSTVGFIKNLSTSLKLINKLNKKTCVYLPYVGDIELIYKAAKFIKDNVPIDNRIFVWGHTPSILYMLTGRMPATRFVNVIFFVTGEKDLRMPQNGAWDLMMEDLVEKQPKVIIDCIPEHELSFEAHRTRNPFFLSYNAKRILKCNNSSDYFVIYSKTD